MSTAGAGSVVSSTTPNGRLVDSDGKATFALLKWMQGVGSTVNSGFDPQGNYQGPIGLFATIAGRQTLASIIANIGTDGIVQAAGIDFAIPYANKDTDHITDGTGHPLAGGKAAEIALVIAPPLAEPHKWINGFAAGLFTKTQPAFGDISGTAAAAQIPPLSGLNGQITDAQLPSDGISVIITTAKLTTLGATGSMQFSNGILIAQVQAT